MSYNIQLHLSYPVIPIIYGASRLPIMGGGSDHRGHIILGIQLYNHTILTQLLLHQYHFLYSFYYKVSSRIMRTLLQHSQLFLSFVMQYTHGRSQHNRYSSNLNPFLSHMLSIACIHYIHHKWSRISTITYSTLEWCCYNT